MMQLFKTPLLFFTLVLPLFSLGVSQGDVDYQIQKEENGDFIFPKEYEENAFTVMDYLDAIFKEYEGSFNHKLTTKPSVILASKNNQIANATATVIPNTIMTWYGGGGSQVDYFNSPSWPATLALHETSHVYQLDAKNKVGEAVSDVLGTNILPFYYVGLPILFFTVPNVTLPDFLLEGDAVFNESRFGIGGRLFGGRHRALFLSLLRGKKLTYKRLLNNHDDFPYMEEKYIVGGYFFAYLNEIYGTKKVNGFFKAHSGHIFNPLRINSTFKKHFGKTYRRLIYDFLQHYMPMANKFSKTSGETVAKSKVYQPMGETNNGFLVFHSDYKSAPNITLFSKEGRRVKNVSGDFLYGKPFFVDNKLYTASSSIVDNKKIAYSLYDTNRDENEKYRNKIVMDIKGKQTLYFNGELFGSTLLFDNEKQIRKIHSSAMFDEEWNIYYFIQKKDYRILYRNNTPLVRLKGYDSKVVDISKQRVYFTAPTQYGNGLYSFKEGESIKRHGNSDDILDAKKLDDNTFLINTVTANGYRYKKARLQEYEAEPVFWSYRFEKNKNFRLFENPPTKTEKFAKERGYNLLRDMRYNSFYPYFALYSYGGYGASFTASFSDPLQQNALAVSYVNELVKDTDDNIESELKAGGLSYVNYKYITAFGFSYYGYDEHSIDPGERDYQFNSFLNYPLYNDTRNRLDVTLQHYKEQKDPKNDPTLLQLGYVKSISYPMSSFPDFFTYDTLYGRTNYEDNITVGFQGSIGYSPATDFYLKGRYKISASKEDVIKISRASQLDIDMADFTMLDFPAEKEDEILAKEAASFKAEGNVFIDSGFYTETFPMSVKDFSLFAATETLNYTKENSTEGTIYEDSVGVTLNLLLLHRFEAPVKFLYVKNSAKAKEEQGTFMLLINTEY